MTDGKLEVTQVRSGIGHSWQMRATLERTRASSIHITIRWSIRTHSSLRGQIKKWRHLITVTGRLNPGVVGVNMESRRTDRSPQPRRRRPVLHRNRKRIGRGPGSGTGKTSGKGHKGIKARAGHHGPGGGKPHFEGGQMPLTRRVPKRGFTNIFRILSTRSSGWAISSWLGGDGKEITSDVLAEAGLIRAGKGPAKVLANGGISRAVSVRGVKVSEGAKAKIVAAGGTVA